MPVTRRDFATTLATLAATRLLRAQSTSAHTPVATLEGDRILTAAGPALKQPITLFTTLNQPPHSKSSQDFYSELAPEPTPISKPKPVFRDHAIALRITSNTVATLTAAFVLTQQNHYALRAGQHLYAWLVDPTTRLNPHFTTAAFDPTKSTGSPAGIVDAAPLAELIRCLAFLTDTAALSPPDLTTTTTWLKALQTWLNTDRNALIARDTKDHAASTWLLLSAALARALRDDTALDACSHRFRKPTLRNQLTSDGAFPHEAATAFPFRNTLFNFDLLTGACQLIATPFDDLWHFELDDGPGMQSLAARLFSILQDTRKWPNVADAEYFREVPTRRPALLFAGRAYNRPEYVDLWQKLPAPDLAKLPEPLAATYPITQPILWTTKAPHGF